VLQEPSLLLAGDGCRQDHAGRGHPVGEKAFDERFELVDGGECDLDEKCFAAGDVMALLDGVDGGEKLQKRTVVRVVAREPDEGGDGEAEGFFIEHGAVSEDDLFGFELMDSLDYGGWRKSNFAAEFGIGDSGIRGEDADDFMVDGIQRMRHESGLFVVGAIHWWIGDYLNDSSALPLILQLFYR
jgi:hypothetical protein